MTGDRPAGRFTGELDFSDFPFWSAQAETGPGIRVGRDQALAVSSVLKGRNLIAGTIATLPICTVDSTLNRVKVPLFEQIDPDVPNSVTMAMTVEDLIFEGISWWQVLARDRAGYPTSCRHITPDFVTFQIPAAFPLNRLPSGYYPGSHVFILDTLTAVPAADIKRFDSPNPALLKAAARTIRRALKHELAADTFADNPAMRGFFTPTDDNDPPDDADIPELLDNWNVARQLHSTGYVPAALKYNNADAMSPADLQMAQLIEKDTRDIANAMGLDPEDLGVSTTSRTYQNAVDRRQDRVNETYGPYIQAIEDRLSMGDMTRRGQSVRLDLDDFLKANPVDRAEIHRTYVDIGAETDDEVRADLGKPALTAEQRKALEPSPVAPPKPEHENLVHAAPAPGLASVTPIRSAPQGYADGPVAARFASEPGPGLVFDVSGVANSFSVNEQKRTITGLVVPWDKVGRSDGKRWKFAPGSLKFDASKVNRIKLLSDHTHSAVIGRVDKTWADEVGQWATFKVARGPDGDKALAYAADGIKDGLSVGVGYDAADSGMTFADDPDGHGDVLYVTSAPWRETSQVAMPAFDDARVSAVQMAADSTQDPLGGVMPDTATEPQAPAQAPAPAAAAATFTTDQVAAMFAAMQANNTPGVAVPDSVATFAADFDTKLVAAVDAAFAKFQADNEGPTVVNPARPGDVATVREEPLYRFDGNKGQRCFTADLATGAFKDDATLRKNAEEFIADQMAGAFANISVTNVTTLNPTIQRPDLYVPNLYFARPIGNLVQGGVVSQITKQTLPKFSSSSGLAQDHTEGTEPTDGAFATTSQDITPKAISGRVDIDREVIEQGGTPQTDQIIWNEMVQFYLSRLETRLVAMFVALSLTDVPIVGTDTDLQSALTTEFAGLQFIKGGDRYRGLALNSDLYTAIMKASDGDGRLLYPPLNPQNAAGTTMSDYSQVRVGNKVGVPAWALATANSGPAKSYLFVPESCYQWFSAPRRFDLDQVNVASVGIGIWGYSAEFCTRNSDVIQLAYTAS